MSYLCLLCYLKYLFSQEEFLTKTTERLNLFPSRWMCCMCKITCPAATWWYQSVCAQCVFVHEGMCISACFWVCTCRNKPCVPRPGRLWLIAPSRVACQLVSLRVRERSGRAMHSTSWSVHAFALFNDHYECFKYDWPMHTCHCEALTCTQETKECVEAWLRAPSHGFGSFCIQRRCLLSKYCSDTFGLWISGSFQ